MIFNNFRNRPVIFLSELLNECMEKLYRAHLLSSKYNHHVCTKAPALASLVLQESLPFFQNSIC